MVWNPLHEVGPTSRSLGSPLDELKKGKVYRCVSGDRILGVYLWLRLRRVLGIGLGGCCVRM
jgi:hypothetical protein